MIQIRSLHDINAMALDKQAVVLLDIDETLLTSTSYYGSIQWVMDHNPHMDEWCESQHLVSTRLLTPLTQEAISLWRLLGARILAFTARRPNTAHITKFQVEDHGIYLDDYIFGSEKITKGAQLLDNIDRIVLPNVDTIVMIDDRKDQIRTVEEVVRTELSDQVKNFYGYHFIGE